MADGNRAFGPENDPFYDLRGDGAGDAGAPAQNGDYSAFLAGVTGRGTAARVENNNAPARVKGAGGLLFVPALACFIGVFLCFFFEERLEYAGLVWVLPALFGGTFFFAGLGASIGAKAPIGLLFTLAGGAVAGISAWYGLSDTGTQGMIMEKAMPACLLSVFVITGLCFLIIPPIIAKKKSAKYTEPVQAIVCGRNERRSRDSDGHWKTYIYLDWKYRAGGQEHVYRSNTGRRPERRHVGDAGTLYIDPKDPGHAWEKPAGAEKFVFLVLGLSFTAAGGIGLAMFLLL